MIQRLYYCRVWVTLQETSVGREKAAALKASCERLEDICIHEGTSSDEDDERENFIVDDED